MKVSREESKDGTAILKVHVSQEDYQTKVNYNLEKQRKRAKTPGFRAGHTPMSVVKKQFGRTILADELNKIVNDALSKFIFDEKIEIIGNPIPTTDLEIVGDFNNPSDFEFSFEIGLKPSVNITLSDKDKFDYVKIKIDDVLVGKQIDDLRRRYGKLVASEKVGESDMILGQFVELNDDDSIKEHGILNSSTISMEFVEDAKTKADFLGKVVGDKIIVNPAHVSRGGKDTAAMLAIKEEDLPNISSKFQMTINEIRHMELADLTQDLFDKLFGEGAINSEKELKDRISVDLEKMFQYDSDKMLTNSVYLSLLANTNVALPKEFLKRWIKISNEKEISLEQIEAQFENYEKSMKWQLIQSEIFKTNNLRLDQKEVVEFTKGLLVNQYAQYGMPAPDDKELQKSAIDVLSKKEESAQIYDMIAEVKLTEYFKATVKLAEKYVSYDEFVSLASNN